MWKYIINYLNISVYLLFMISTTVSGQTVSRYTLDLFAAYAGAAYKVSNSWDCSPECQHPGTEGTEIVYNWEPGLDSSLGYIAINPNSNLIIVAFRGSASIADWINSLTITPQYWPTSIKGSVVEAGFVSGYEIVSSKVQEVVYQLAKKYSDYSIVSTGHSLGGAHATYFVADMSVKSPELVSRTQLFTYGQAKSGNQVFAQHMNSLGIPIFREVNKGDLTPQLPPGTDPYVHCGTEAWIMFNNQIRFCPYGDYSQCSEGLSKLKLGIQYHETYPEL